MTDQQQPPESQDPFGRPAPPTDASAGWAPPPADPNQWQQQPYQQPYPQPSPDTGATTALVLGILSLLICPLILSIPAIIIGNTAKQKAAVLPGQPGLSSAKAGVILGWVSLALSVVYIIVVIGIVASGNDV